MHQVPQDFEPEGISRVLQCMTPEAARVMWASKTFQVRCSMSALISQRMQCKVDEQGLAECVRSPA